jgi:hypothetical protein
VGSNIIGQYTCLLTNNVQELTPYRFEFKCDTNRIRIRFEPVSLGWMTDALANSATQLLLWNTQFWGAGLTVDGFAVELLLHVRQITVHKNQI